MYSSVRSYTDAQPVCRGAEMLEPKAHGKGGPAQFGIGGETEQVWHGSVFALQAGSAIDSGFS